MDVNEVNDENSGRVSLDIFEQKIKANLKLLHTQISALAEMMNRVIQINSAIEVTTATNRKLRLQSDSTFTGAPGTSRFPLIRPPTHHSKT